MEKRFEQLDLFGFPIEQSPAPKKKTAAPKPANQAIPVIQPPKVETIPEPAITEHVQIEEITEKEPIVSAKQVQTKAISKPGSKRGRKSFKEMDSEADLIDVPEDSVLQQKLYYSISEVAGWFKVNTSLLRFWENEFDILQPRKTRKGDRLFRVEDVKNLQLIYFLLRQRKFSIDGAKKYLKNNKREADMQAQVVQSLTKFKSFLLELKSTLSH